MTPGSGRSPGRKWQPTPVFLLGKSHGQKSLMDCSPWGYKRVRHDLVTKQQQKDITIRKRGINKPDTSQRMKKVEKKK